MTQSTRDVYRNRWMRLRAYVSEIRHSTTVTFLLHAARLKEAERQV
jgi:hypothetical protein